MSKGAELLSRRRFDAQGWVTAQGATTYVDLQVRERGGKLSSFICNRHSYWATQVLEGASVMTER
jgi:hypothetical protein